MRESDIEGPRATLRTRRQSYGMTKIVENYGCLYRLTDANYRRLLTFVAAGEEYDLCELGAHIGCVHVSMVNFGKDDAEFELSRLQIEPGSRFRSGHASRR